MAYTKVKLSGSTDGRGIKVAATATPGTAIHTANGSALDEIWLYAFNHSGAAILLTIEFGGVSSPDDLIKMTIPSQTGALLVVPGFLLTNSLLVKAWAASANQIMIHGYVNRIS